MKQNARNVKLENKKKEMVKNREEEISIKKIRVTIPASVKELSLPDVVLDNIRFTIQQEEFNERVIRAKELMLQASRMEIDTEAGNKLKKDYTKFHRLLLFKRRQLSAGKIVEKDETLVTEVKPFFKIRCEMDNIIEILEGLEKQLKLRGINPIELEKKIEGESNAS